MIEFINGMLIVYVLRLIGVMLLIRIVLPDIILLGRDRYWW